MYRFLYGLLYLLSLLPWALLYTIGDGLYLLLYYIIGYRRKVVKSNLQMAFPEKSADERKRIEKAFYHNFIDQFIETLKMISITEEEVRKRCTGNRELIDQLPESIPNLIIVSAHFFNWEYANLINSLDKKDYTFLGVYMPVGNKAFDQIMLNMRSKFGAVLLPATNFRRHFLKYAKHKFTLGLIADQRPGDPSNAAWIPFFNILTPFVKGPERNAKASGSAVVFLHIEKRKRGHYYFDYQLVTTDPQSKPDGALTKQLIQLTEAAIRRQPSNYLWTHKRWKWTFNEQDHGHLVIK